MTGYLVPQRDRLTAIAIANLRDYFTVEIIPPPKLVWLVAQARALRRAKGGKP